MQMIYHLSGTLKKVKEWTLKNAYSNKGYDICKDKKMGKILVCLKKTVFQIWIG